jgi:hypothetical protein
VNNDVTESAQFTSQRAKVTVNVGGEAIVPAASSTTNRFWITTAVSGCLATTTTGSTAADGIDVGISAFTNNSYEQGLVTVSVNYLDALGVTETATKTITFKKQRNSVPTIDLNVNPTSQTLSANSLGAVAGGNTTAGYTTLNVTATENGVSRFDRIKSVSQLPVSTITTAISTNTVTLNNMVSGSDSVQLTLDEVHYTFGEGSYGTGSLKSSVTKARKAAPVLRIEVAPKDQSVTAKSTGEQIGAFAKAFVSIKETYDGATTTRTISSLTATSADIANIQTTASTGEITLAGRTLANGVDSTTVAISATINDSEGSSRTLTDSLTLSKVKNAAPTTLVTITPEGQNVASSSTGYGTPANVTITAKESSNYSYDDSSPFGNSTFRVSVTGGTNNNNGTVTPTTPTTDAGTTTTITINYVNSEGVAGSETRTHKVTPAKDGRQGPGLLYIGDYATKKAAEPGFVLNNSSTKRDAVKHSGKFYAFRGADLTTIGATSTPTAGGDASWEEFTSFSAVATGLLIAEESYVQNTINVGTNAAGNAANITIWGGNGSPYISIGQGGTKGYNASGKGIFLGTDASTSKISVKNTAGSKYILWDGENLSIAAGNFSLDTSGNVNASNVTLSGNLTATTLTASTAGTIGGWLIASNKIYNSNVDIDNANSRIDLSSGGVVKTRIKSGNADIGSFTTMPIRIAAGSLVNTTEVGSEISPGPKEVNASAGGNSGTASFTAPAGAGGLAFSITVPYPALASVGSSTVNNLGTGTSWDWSYYARLDYVVRLDNMSGTAVASGFKTLSQNSYTSTIPSPGSITHPGFGAGTMIIPNIATATAGQVYWVNVYLATNVRTRINPSGATPIGGGGVVTAIAQGWDAINGNAGLLAVANRAEYATNGAQIGSAEGTYVAFGDAAGAGYVGNFNGNVQVIGVLTAGSVSASDKRAKTNVQPIQNGIETIKKLNPVKFDWLQHITGNHTFEKGYGFIADDVEAILPDLIYEKKGYQFEDFKHLEYNSFHAIAIKAIQELSEKVEKLEAQLSGSNNSLEEVK